MIQELFKYVTKTSLYVIIIFILLLLGTGRKILTDSYNSIFHVMFGMLGYYNNYITASFFIYQSVEYYVRKDNFIVDINEFIIGYLLSHIYSTS